MPTGSEFVNAAMKRFLSQNRIANEIIEYLQENSFDILARIFPAQGLFTYPVTITPGTGDFDLSVSPTGPIEGTDGLGHALSLATSRQSSIAFEDTATDTYWIGMKYIEIPNGIYDNPRTGKPEYDKFMEEVGELDVPTSVTDVGGGQIQLNVNSIFESGVDHSGRTVRVWLVDPLSGDETVAFEDLTVAFSTPNNTVTTNASFGQGTISTTVADYQVACLGVTVRKSVSNPFSSEYVIIGNILSGSGADTGSQVDFSGGGGHTLQAAYDGVGSGAGRNATIADGAIRLVQENDTVAANDETQAVLKAVKDTDKAVFVDSGASRNLESGIEAWMRLSSRGGFSHYVNIHDATGADNIIPEEEVQVVTAGATLTFYRTSPTGLDLTLSGLSFQLWPTVDIVKISGSTQGNDGVYIIATVASSTTLTLVDWDGTASSLAQETSGTNPNLRASIYRPVCRIGSKNSRLELYGIQDILDDLTLTTEAFDLHLPDNAPDDEVVFRIHRDGSPDDEVRIYGNADIDTTGVISGASVTAPSVTASSGDVTASNDLVAGNEITLSSAQTEYIHINGGDGFSEYDLDTAPAHAHAWTATLSANSGFDAYSMLTTTPAQGKKIYYPFRLPHGCTLTSVEALVKDKGGTNNITMKIYQAGAHTWSAGSEALGSRSQIGSTQTSDGSGSLDLLSATSLGHTFDSTRAYCVEMEDDEDPAGAIIYELRIGYTWDTVRL